MRTKTEFRHVNTKTGKVTRVTCENGCYYIGDTNIRAEGKMVHFNGVKHINFGPNRFRKLEPQDEWSDYCYSQSDY